MHPKGVSPLSSGENTNSYKELLKMKKILSVLLAMVMIVSSITVAFVAFAAAADPADVVEKINAQSAYIANADNGDGTSHKLPGYLFQRSLNSNVIFSDDNVSNINSVMDACYPEYSADPYHNSDGSYNYDTILENLVGLTAKQAQVKKNSDASLTIGRDALKALNLDAADVVSATKIGSVYTLKYADIDLAADEKVEDSVLADISANYPQATGLDNVIMNSVVSHNTALTVENFTLTITNLQIKVTFNTAGRITNLTYSYKLNGRASVTYINPTPFDAVFSLAETTSYSSFAYFNENNDFDYAELAARVNAGTANMVNTKAGYDYARLSNFNGGENENGDHIDYIFGLNTSGLIKSNTILSTALGAILGFVDKIEIRVDEKLGTDIRAKKWVCKNSGSENSNDICTSSKPHQVWQCTCKDVSGCCSCCPAGTGCTSTHPCDKDGACRSADCKCGYVNDPNCGYNMTTQDELESMDASLATVFQTLGTTLSSSMGTAAKKQFAIGTTSANIPVAAKATDKLDARYAVKATELDVFDIQSASFDSATGAITFTLDEQTEANGYKGLSHLTNDYVTNEEFVKALNVSLANSASALTNALKITLLNSQLSYTDVTCTVKFVGASADNMYGTGEIERINLSYNSTAMSIDKQGEDFSEPVITYVFSNHVDSTAKNVKYADYEKGDANMDTNVSLMDAKLVLRYVAELETLNDYQMLLADMNEDSAVTIVDAKAILEKIASQTV